MYGIYANIWGILMVNVTIYIAYMDPMGLGKKIQFTDLNSSVILGYFALKIQP